MKKIIYTSVLILGIGFQAYARHLGPGEAKGIKFVNNVCNTKLDVDMTVEFPEDSGPPGQLAGGTVNYWIRAKGKLVCDSAAKGCEARKTANDTELTSLKDKWYAKCASESCTPYDVRTGTVNCGGGQVTVTCPNGGTHSFPRVNGVIQWPPFASDPCGGYYNRITCKVPSPAEAMNLSLTCTGGSGGALINFDVTDELQGYVPHSYDIFGSD